MATVGQLAQVLWERHRKSSHPAVTPGTAIRYILDSLGLTDAEVLEGRVDKVLALLAMGQDFADGPYEQGQTVRVIVLKEE